MVFYALNLLRWKQECVDDVTVRPDLDSLEVLP